MTMTDAVSVQPFDVQMKLYVPATVRPLMIVVGEVAELMVAVAGFPFCADQVPDPVAAIVAVEN